MARIALDARPIVKPARTGVENVATQFVRLILKVPRRHAWYFYFTDPPVIALPSSANDQGTCRAGTLLKWSSTPRY